MVEPVAALPGRAHEVAVPELHEVLGTPLKGPFPESVQTAVFGMGCFWGAERIFWEADGVYTTAVGYAGGTTPNPTYEEVCSGRTGHSEVVLVAFDEAKTSYQEMLQTVLGGARPHPGHAPGQRRRHPVPLADPLRRRRPASGRAGLAGGLPADALSCRPRHDHHRARRSSTRSTPSTTPRPTTSSTWPRTPADTAGSAAPASPARSASPAEPRRGDRAAPRAG